MSKDESSSWYAIRTFNCKELDISAFLEEKELCHFVPMGYVDKFEKGSDKPKRVLVPVIHNYLFLQKTKSSKEIAHILQECAIPMSIIKRDGTNDFYEIPEREMAEFRLLCDPKFDNSVFMKSDEAEAKPGKLVTVVHGPFTGIRGKLHRVHNDYYFVKAFVGIGVMMRISRWYCKVDA